MAIIATAGAADANSYVTMEEAEAYLATRFGGAVFAAADESDQEIALIQATRQIDRHRFHGRKNSVEQALEFPRAYPYTEPVTPSEVPRKVKDACCEQALHLVAHKDAGGAGKRQQLQAEGVQSFSVGDLSETFAPGLAGASEALCNDARVLLRGWIDRTGRITVTGREEAYGPGDYLP